MNVVITGASAGIGQAFARAFAAKGHHLVLCARRQDRLDELAAELSAAYGIRAVTVALDLTDSAAPQTLFTKSMEAFGKIHVLINNAGMSPWQEFAQMKMVDLRATLQLNVNSLTEICHHFVPHMRGHGENSHIANVGSVGSYAPLPKFAVYTGTKHYVRAFSDLLFYELRKTNIRVTCVCPGGTSSEFLAKSGQEIKAIGQSGMMTPTRVAAIATAGILSGKRVVVTGRMNLMVAFLGKVLPFPWFVRILDFVYSRAINQKAPNYSG